MVTHVSSLSFSGLFGSKFCLLYCMSHIAIGTVTQENETTLLQILGQLLAILKHVYAYV